MFPSTVTWIMGGILGEDALYDAAPLRRLLKDFADDAKLRASGRLHFPRL